MQSASISIRRLAVLVCLVAAFAVVASAQFRAGVQGVVKDSAGGVVGGATVTLTNRETNQTVTATTSDEGFYRFSNLAPGRYSLTAERESFKKALVDDLTVEAEAIKGQDIVLEAGVISETVTVEAENTGLQTEDANIRNTLSTAEILRLPQVGRDPYELARLTPGVFGSGARSANGGSVGLPNTTGPGGSNSSIFQVENQVPITANGQRVSANSYQIDGVSVDSQTWGGAAVLTPSQEGVKEVQVTASTYSAEDGRNSGASVKVVTQNGTNDFHGSAFFKYNDPSLNAFNKFPGNPQKVLLKNRQYGGSIGGPILKNRAFFFFVYEGARDSTNNPVTNVWIETAQYRQLVISSRPSSVIARIFQAEGIEPRIVSTLPATCATINLAADRCAAVSGGLDIGSPAVGTSPTNPYVVNSNIGGGLDGIPDIQLVNIANPVDFRGNQFNPRVDINLTDNDTLTFSSFFTLNDRTSANPSGRSRPMADLTSNRLNWAFTGIYNRLFSTTMINQFRFNINAWSFDEIKSNPDLNWGIPRIEVEGLPFDRIRFGADRSEGTPGVFDEKQITVRDVFTWTLGNHVLKFGGDFRKELNNNSLVGGARPLYSFVGLWNLANDAPVFESINADPSTGLGATATREIDTNNYAFFVQDDWKVRSSLTLNLGLRWEYFAPLKDKAGQQSNIFLGPNGLIDAQVRPVEQLYNSDWNNFGPQVGFAYSPGFLDRKGVLRGGFGIGYNRLPNSIFLNSRGNPPFFSRFGLCCGTSGSPFAGGRILFALGSDSTPTSYPANPVLGSGINPVTGTPNGGAVEIYGSDQDIPTSYVYRYSLDAEYELPYSLVATLGYQGSSGRNFTRLQNQRYVFPQDVGSIYTAVYFPKPDVSTNYNAMNARMQRRFANGLQFDVIYRWSKSLDSLSYEGPGFVTNQTYPVDNSTEYGPSDFDVRHNWAISGLWDLPFFRKGDSWASKVLGGWQLNGIWTYHTGFPWTPKLGTGLTSFSTASFGDIRPTVFYGTQPLANTNENFLGQGLFPDNLIPGANCRTTVGGCSRYFLTTVASPNTFQNNPPGIGRNVFRGPKYRSLDLSLVKRFRLDGLLGMKEGSGLDLRANFFNVFNQLNLSNFGFGDNAVYVDRAQFGRAQSALAGRTVELQVRFNF